MSSPAGGAQGTPFRGKASGQRRTPGHAASVLLQIKADSQKRAVPVSPNQGALARRGRAGESKRKMRPIRAGRERQKCKILPPAKEMPEAVVPNRDG